MDRWEREGLLAANNGMRNQLDHILDAFEHRRGRIQDIYRQSENARTQAYSPDRTVEVTVDAGGVLTDLHLTAEAVRRTPEQLSRSIVDAVQAAAARARQQTEALAAPVDAVLDDLPDYPDLAPEAAGLHEIRSFFRGENSGAPT